MTHNIPSHFKTEPEQTAYQQGYLRGWDDALIQAFKKASYEYSSYTRQYYMTVKGGPGRIEMNDKGIETALEYSAKFRRLYKQKNEA